MRSVLQFSGGKDSLAVLMLCQKVWDEICVVWVNTGAAYSDVVDYMDMWERRLPHFFVVESNQPEQIRENGWPVDVVPVNRTRYAANFMGCKGCRFQSYLDCCKENIWLPMHDASMRILNDGVAEEKFILRGQRDADTRKAPARSGDVVDGVTYLFPIQDWTDEQVWQYLKDVKAPIPPYYAEGEKTSRDCWDCTAYVKDNGARIQALPEHKRAIVEFRLAQLRQAVQEELP